MTKEEIASALASYLWPPDRSLPEEAWELMEGNEVYAFPFKTADPRVYSPSAFVFDDRVRANVVDEAYSEALSTIVSAYWDEVGWLGQPAIVRTPHYYTLVAAADPPSFRRVEFPHFLSELAIPARRARKRLSDVRKILKSVKDEACELDRELRTTAFWMWAGSRWEKSRRQDWRPGQTRR